MTGRPVVAALLAGLMLLTCAPSTRTELAAANPSTQAAQATLTVLSASVTVVAGDSGIAHPGVSGQTVGVGDRILTDPSGGATLTFVDGSELQLDAGTEVLVKALGQTDGGGLLTTIAQAGGVTINRVAQLGANSSYQLETPSATALVRGTVFRGRVVRDPQTRNVLEEDLSVEQGSVVVRLRSGLRLLAPGQRLRIIAGLAGTLEAIAGDPTLTVEPGGIVSSREGGGSGGSLGGGGGPSVANAPLSMEVAQAGPDPNSSTFEVHFKDPTREAQRGAFTYAWSLDLKGSDCARFADRFTVGPQKFQAKWSHPPCTHGPDEQVNVQVALGSAETTQVQVLHGKPDRPGIYGP
jgi:hypothetical protein